MNSFGPISYSVTINFKKLKIINFVKLLFLNGPKKLHAAMKFVEILKILEKVLSINEIQKNLLIFVIESKFAKLLFLSCEVRFELSWVLIQ